jgi:predicted NBD/HSP70 family sugar kinase
MSIYEERSRAFNFKATDPRDLFTSAGRRVYYSDLENAVNDWRLARREVGDLARRALAGDRQAIDQFDARLRKDKEGLAELVVALLGIGAIVVGGRALSSRLKNKKRERGFPQARVLPPR